jgi:hypothetical protein
MSAEHDRTRTLNAALVQEMTLQSTGISAEGNAEAFINMIPKEGGNTPPAPSWPLHE